MIHLPAFFKKKVGKEILYLSLICPVSHNASETPALPNQVSSSLSKKCGQGILFPSLICSRCPCPSGPRPKQLLKKSWITDSMAVASLEISFFAPAPAPVHREPGKSVRISPNGCSHAPFLPVFPKEKGQEAQAARPVLDSFRDFSGMRDFPGRASRPCLSRRLVVSCP